jgi:hypothetical protein
MALQPVRVSSQELITAATFNSLQARVENILGVGIARLGYGQAVESSQVGTTDVVTADDLRRLKNDINKIRVHQTGSLSNLDDIDSQDLIGAADVEGNTNKGFNAFLSIVDTLEGDVYEVDATQYTIETATSSIRYTPWNGTPVHSFTITFDDGDHRRAFFNAGGEIHISAELITDNSLKGQDWATMLQNMGTLKFQADTTVITGTQGSVNPIGNFDLTSSYQTIFERQGGEVEYSENRYLVTVKELSLKAIQFKIQFLDNDQGDQVGSGAPEDELVTGALSSIIKQLRPTGSAVSVKSPAYSTQTDLSTG